MNNNHFTKALISIGAFIFTIEHPLLFSLGCLIYFLSNNITPNNMIQLRQYITNSKLFINNLRDSTKELGISVTAGREILANYWDDLTSILTPEQIDQIRYDSFLKDKLKDTIQSHFAPVKDEWDARSLNDLVEEGEFIDSLDTEFITYFIPDFDLDKILTRKEYNRMMKKLKAAMRNPDGSIKNEVGDLVLKIVEDSLLSTLDLEVQKSFDLMTSETFGEEAYEAFRNRAWKI